MRLLLHHAKGPMSFNELKTVSDEILPSFKDACRERGLLQDDSHWLHTMEDAERTRLPKGIRDVFVVLLINSEINNLSHIWERFKDIMSQDFRHLEQKAMNDFNLLINERHYDQALPYLQEKLVTFGNKLQDFNLPTPNNIHIQHNVNFSDLLFEQQYNIQEQTEFVKQKESLLNDEQKSICDFVSNFLNKGISEMIFIDALGGTGKTFLINLILAKVRSAGNIAVAVASSGIAATLMPGGRAAHSMFKIPLTVKENELCNFDKNSNSANLFINTKISIWDECPMMRRESFEAVDRTLQDMCNNTVPFGGIFIICSGDF